MLYLDLPGDCSDSDLDLDLSLIVSSNCFTLSRRSAISCISASVIRCSLFLRLRLDDVRWPLVGVSHSVPTFKIEVLGVEVFGSCESICNSSKMALLVYSRVFLSHQICIIKQIRNRYNNTLMRYGGKIPW